MLIFKKTCGIKRMKCPQINMNILHCIFDLFHAFSECCRHSEVPTPVCRDVIAAADVSRFRICQVCSLCRALTCTCSMHSASFQVSPSSPQPAGFCHHNTQQHGQNQLERDPLPTMATNAELSVDFKSTAFADGCSEQHELATEV